jgi:hypothetical protein
MSSPINGPVDYGKTKKDHLNKLRDTVNEAVNEATRPAPMIKDWKDTHQIDDDRPPPTRKELIQGDLRTMTYKEVMELGEELLKHIDTACDKPPELFAFCAWIMRWAHSGEKRA